MTFLTELEQPIQTYMGPQKTQSNPEEQKPSKRSNSPRLQAILQSHNNPDSVVLVPKYTFIPIPHSLDDCGFVILPKVWERDASWLVFVP